MPRSGFATFRSVLPAGLLFFVSTPLFAEGIEGLGMVPQPRTPQMPECHLTQDAGNCVRFLACVGTDGLWVDGQVHGWNRGTLKGQRNDGAICVGVWTASDGPMGSGTADFECSDGSVGKVIYFSQDSLTGTAIGRGMDSKGRHVKAWSGDNVLTFLGDGDVDAARLPCQDTPVFLSGMSYADW